MSESGEETDGEAGTDAEVEVAAAPIPRVPVAVSPQEPLGQFEETQELPRIQAPPGFADASSPKRVDPWNEPTPRDLPDEKQAALLEAAPEEESPYLGDGPFAAPLDHPKESLRDRSQKPPPRAASELSREERLRVPPQRTVSELQREERARNAFSAPLMVQRRNTRMPSTPGRPMTSAEPGAGAMTPRARAGSTSGEYVPSTALARTGSGVSQPAPERKYPKMRALLEKPDEVPHGSAAPVRASRTRPVPGTFFPAPREREVAPMRAAPADLDEMLATMAEGLLIGEGPGGETEVRVTLRDEFFAGTELRIVAGDGRVRAVLIPPDRGTYLTLNGNIDELRMRLEARGLSVEELRVAEP